MKMSNLPLVSIIVVTYNHETFIEDCIESIVSQKYPNIEIIICDDASTDNTKIIIEKLQNIYPLIVKPIYHSKNIGIPANVNSGLKKIIGKYFCFLAGDDLYGIDFLNISISYLENNLSIIGTYGKHQAFDSETKKILWNYNPENKRFKSRFEILRLGHSFHIPCFTYVIRTEFLEFFDERLPLSNDALFSAIIESKGNLHFINKFFYLYRKHSSSITYKTKNDFDLALKENLRMYELLQEKVNAPDKFFLMAKSREYTYLSFKLAINQAQVDRIKQNIKISREIYEANFFNALYYIIRYKSIWQMLQIVLGILVQIRLVFILRYIFIFLKKIKIAPRIIE